jgi:cbb3-type cytochrome oxidase subunit 3
MRLTDVMSHMNLALFPKAALVIFLAVFVAVTLKVYLKRGRHFDHMAALPLDDGQVSAVSHEGASHG